MSFESQLVVGDFYPPPPPFQNYCRERIIVREAFQVVVLDDGGLCSRHVAKLSYFYSSRRRCLREPRMFLAYFLFFCFRKLSDSVNVWSQHIVCVCTSFALVIDKTSTR